MSDKQELKPCLYCGREPIAVQPNGLGPKKSVFCKAKSCIIFGILFEPEAWNKRPTKAIESLGDNIASFRSQLTALKAIAALHDELVDMLGNSAIYIKMNTRPHCVCGQPNCARKGITEQIKALLAKAKEIT